RLASSGPYSDPRAPSESVAAEVVGEDVAGFQLRCGSAERELAATQHVRRVGDVQDSMDELVDDQDRHPTLGDELVLDELEDGVDEQGGESQRGFVHEDQPLFAYVRPGDGEHLLFATAEGAGMLGEPLTQPWEGFGGELDRARLLPLGRLHDDVLADGQTTIDSTPFGDMTQTPSGALMGG